MKIKPSSSLQLFSVFLCAVLFSSSFALARMYKWTDKDGKLHYSQTPPPNQQKQKFEELSIIKNHKQGNPKCCAAIQGIANKMILAQTKGATITDLYAFFQHPQVGDLKEIANYVSHKFELEIEPSLISQMTYDTCVNAGFNLCVGNSNVAYGQSSGSGFYVNSGGHIVTNHHVINGCSNIRIQPGNESAEVVAINETVDLAILKSKSTSDYARFSNKPIEIGEAVIVAGFPYRGELSSGISVTTGTVSALAGPKDDTRLIQITAPVQPGNSGGPLLDSSGNVTAIVVGKLNSFYFAQKYRDIPQNINFAIRSRLALEFLNENDVLNDTDRALIKVETTEISKRAAKFTVVVECEKGIAGI